MRRRSVYLTWIGIGMTLGGLTVSLVGTVYFLGVEIRSNRPADMVIVYAAWFIGAFYGAIGGAIAGLFGAMVSRALAHRDVRGTTVHGAVAAGVAAAIAVPVWTLMWPTTSWSEFISAVVLPLVVAVAAAFFGGLLIWRLTDGRATTAAD